MAQQLNRFDSPLQRKALLAFGDNKGRLRPSLNAFQGKLSSGNSGS
jgi:hypothetical protein